MRISTLRTIAVAAVQLLALAGATQASAQSLERGDYIVHYSALPTTTLAPEVARQYAITRSAGRALLNVAVQRRGANGTPKAIAATIDGAATNPVGQRQSLALRVVREGDAIYYLAEPRIDTPLDTLDFELDVVPDGATAPITVRFRQEFHAPAAR